MPDPALALLVFAALVAVTAALVWPGVGVLARVRRGGRANLRVEMEDALKHLYKVAYRGGEASPESLAGALQISQSHATRLLSQLKGAGLVREGSTARLTDDGSAYALRVIRTHRLWERYLADRTGVAPADWHTEAERREHEMSDDDVERLSARLGHPRYDPHGDPIPTASGDLPAAFGVPLTHLEPGDTARIVHLEDEPHDLYDRLVGMGLSPHMDLRVLEGPPGSVVVEVDGRTLRMEDGAAQNVTVTSREAGDVSTGEDTTLLDVPAHGEAVVRGISPACQGIQRRRLLDLGLVPGTTVRTELTAAGGDPRAFLVRGAIIALRREQQRAIRVTLPDAATTAAGAAGAVSAHGGTD